MGIDNKEWQKVTDLAIEWQIILPHIMLDNSVKSWMSHFVKIITSFVPPPPKRYYWLHYILFFFNLVLSFFSAVVVLFFGGGVNLKKRLHLLNPIQWSLTIIIETIRHVECTYIRIQARSTATQWISDIDHSWTHYWAEVYTSVKQYTAPKTFKVYWLIVPPYLNII